MNVTEMLQKQFQESAEKLQNIQKGTKIKKNLYYLLIIHLMSRSHIIVCIVQCPLVIGYGNTTDNYK